MAIINLGTLPRRANPLGEALVSGVDAYTKSKRFKEEQDRRDKRQAEAILSQQNFSKKEKDLAMVKNMVQNFADMPEDKRKMFVKTDGYKDTIKLVNRVAPEYINEDGELVTLPASPKAGMSKEDIIAMKVDLQSALAKARAGQPPTPEEAEATIKYLEIAEFEGAISPEEAQAGMKEAGRFLSRKASRFADGLGSDLNRNLNPKDPLGIR